MVKVIDAAGDISTFAYNANHQMVNQQVGPLNVTYTYAANGTVTQINQGLGTITTIACVAAQGLGAGNPPNLGSAVAAVTDPLGRITSYTLDPFGRANRPNSIRR